MLLKTGVIICQQRQYLEVFTVLAEVWTLRFSQMPSQVSLRRRQLVLSAWHCPARHDSVPVQFGVQYSACAIQCKCNTVQVQYSASAIQCKCNRVQVQYSTCATQCIAIQCKCNTIHVQYSASAV